MNFGNLGFWVALAGMVMSPALPAAAAGNAGAATAIGLPRPLFYLPLDGAAAARIAGGSRWPRQVPPREPLLSPLFPWPGRYVPGRVGKALQIEHAPLLYDCAGNFRADEGAVSFFLAPDFRGDDRRLYCTFFGAADWGMIYKYRNQASLTFATRRPAGEGGDLYYDCSSPALGAWKPGQWRHVAATWSRRANRRVLYIDGVEAASAPYPFVPKVHSGRLYIGGGCRLYPGHAAHARIDEFALWSTALTASQIRKIYALGRAGRPLLAAEPGPHAAGPARCPAPFPRARGTAETPPRPSRETPTRDRLVLNGAWRFLPVRDAETPPPATAPWGTVQLPGYWSVPGTVRTPNGKAAGGRWQDGRKLADFPLAYCRRNFRIPKDWKAGTLFLHFGGIDGVTEVCLDGRHLAALPPWEPVRLPLGAALDSSRSEHTLTLAVRRRDKTPNTGIYGEIALERLPRVFLQDIRVLPSFSAAGRPARITFSCRVWSAKNRPAVRVIFEVRPRGNAGGGGERRFQAETALTAADPALPAYRGAGLHRFRFPWPDAHPWTFDDPFLYDLRVRIEAGNRVLDVSRPIRFGFREFRIRGGDFTLNGVPAHLRGHQVDLGWRGQWKALQQFQETGADCFEFSAPIRARWYAGTPWRERLYRRILDFADEHGMIAVAALPDATELKDAIFDSVLARAYSRRVDKHLRRYGNHACFCMGFMDFNLAGYPRMLAPAALDGSYRPSASAWRQKLRYALEAQRLVQRLAPLPIYHHSCGNFGDVYCVNCYIGPTAPLQEREEWPSRWAASRRFPLVACEHGLMLIPYWYRPRKFPLSAVYAGEPIFDEICAMYFGPRAYAEITPEVFDLYDLDRPHPRPGRNRRIIAHHPGYQHLKALFARRSLRAWRIWGVSGIIFNAIEWDFQDEHGRDLPVKKALRRWFGPTDLAITGPGRDWPGKDHAWFAGETVRKQAVLINDFTHPLSVTLAWRVLDSAGTPIRSGRRPGIVARPGRPTAVPISFPAPRVAKRTDFLLEVRGTGKAARFFPADPFRFTVFPRLGPAPLPSPGETRILLADSAGATRTLLQALGIHAEPLAEAAELRPGDRIIVGRDGWTAEFAARARRLHLDHALAEGARLLVFEQKPPARPFGLELVETSTRRAFPLVADSPILAGLQADDLRDFRGASHRIPAYPPPAPETIRTWPRRFYKWGNRGIVATFVYKKPEYGPFCPILECGFDLAQSPLLEARVGRGLALLCNLDITERCGRDPVAARLVRNLLARFLAGSPLPPPARVRAGGDAARAFLRRFRVSPVAPPGTGPVRPAAESRGVLWVVGPDAAPDTVRQALAGARNGATVLVLPGWNPAAAHRLGLHSVAKRLFIGRPRPAPLARGVSAADLYFKRRLPLASLRLGPGWREIAAPGLCAVRRLERGRIVACSIPAGDSGRTREGVKEVRFWERLLANLGAPLEWSSAPRPGAGPYLPDPWEEIPPYKEW